MLRCRNAGVCLTALLGLGVYLTLLLVGVYDMPSVVRRSSLFTCRWPPEQEVALNAKGKRSSGRGATARPRPARLMIHQDADANYAPLLDITTAHHERYAARRGYTFDKYIGSLSGWPYPMLNRVWRLVEMVGKPFGWFVYMDADALVYDPRCAFEDLLENRSAARFAMLFCHDPMGRHGVRHHVNAGVFVANLRHPLIGPLACTWKRRLWWEAWRYQALTTRLYRRLVLGKPPEPCWAGRSKRPLDGATAQQPGPARTTAPGAAGLLYALEWSARAAQLAMRGCGATAGACQRLSACTFSIPDLEDQRILHDLLREFGPRYPSLYQAVPEELCTFNTMSGTLVRHVFGGSGAKARVVRMRWALNSSLAAHRSRKRGRVRGKGPRQEHSRGAEGGTSHGTSCVAMTRPRQRVGEQKRGVMGADR